MTPEEQRSGRRMITFTEFLLWSVVWSTPRTLTEIAISFACMGTVAWLFYRRVRAWWNFEGHKVWAILTRTSP